MIKQVKNYILSIGQWFKTLFTLLSHLQEIKVRLSALEKQINAESMDVCVSCRHALKPITKMGELHQHADGSQYYHATRTCTHCGHVHTYILPESIIKKS